MNEGQQQQTPGGKGVDFQSLEEFNSDRSVLRVTTDRIPLSGNLQKEIALPLGVIVKPFGDPSTVSLCSYNFE